MIIRFGTRILHIGRTFHVYLDRPSVDICACRNKRPTCQHLPRCTADPISHACPFSIGRKSSTTSFWFLAALIYRLCVVIAMFTTRAVDTPSSYVYPTAIGQRNLGTRSETIFVAATPLKTIRLNTNSRLTIPRTTFGITAAVQLHILKTCRP